MITHPVSCGVFRLLCFTPGTFPKYIVRAIDQLILSNIVCNLLVCSLLKIHNEITFSHQDVLRLTKDVQLSFCWLCFLFYCAPICRYQLNYSGK